jgi:hypothetical protein
MQPQKESFVTNLIDILYSSIPNANAEFADQRRDIKARQLAFQS